MKKKSLLFLLLLALFAPWAAMGQSTLTVHDGGNTNGYVPIYGTWADAYLKCEMVYPADELDDMVNGTINSIKFYATSPASAAWTGTWQVSLMTFANTTISSFAGPGTVVYEGLLDGTQSEMEITFNSPYVYEGGNLLVCVYQIATGNWKGITWSGETVNGASVQGYSSSSLGGISPTQQNFLPKTTFGYTPGEAPTCEKPTNLAVDYSAGTTATATWTGTANLYNIDINNVTIEGVTSPYTFTIEPNTTYEVKVQADCGGGDLSLWAAAPSYTTPCLDFSLPYTYGFEDASDLNCWTMVYTANTPGINGDQHHDGSKCFRFSSYSSASSYDQYLISPTFNTANGIEFSFYYKPYSYGAEVFTVGYSTTTNDASAFTWGDDITTTAGDDWNLYEATYPAGTKYVAIYYHSDYAYYLYVDDFSFEVASDCKKPTDLNYSRVTARTADLGWAPGSDETQWQICLNNDETNLILVNDSPSYSLTGLTPETTYSVKVRSYCGADEQSGWCTPVEFTTLVACPAPANMNVTDITSNSAVVSWEGDDAYELRYGTVGGRNRGTLTYDFENGLGDWTTIDADGDGFTWVTLSDLPNYTSSYGDDLSSWAHGGSDAVLSGSYINGMSSITTTPDNLLVSPMVALGGSITFYAKGLDGNYPEHFGVCVSTTNGTDVNAFTVLQEWDTETDTEYHEYTVDLSAYTGMGYIAFRDFNVEDMYVVIIDDVTIEEGVTGEVTWIETVTGVTSPYNLTGLDPETPYIVQVRANCGEDGYSEWVQRGFVTKGVCDVPTALTTTNVEAYSATLGWFGVQDSYNVQYRTAEYKETLFFTDFDEGSLPTGWSTTGDIFYWTGTSDNFVLLGYSEAGTQYMITSDLTNYEGAGTIEFMQRYLQSAMNFKVGFSTTTNDVDAFAWSDDIAATASESIYSVTIPTGAKYFAVQATTTASEENGLVIDDFGIYTPVVEASQWITIQNVTSPYTLDGVLRSETKYEWQVQGICTDGVTEWSAIADFTTEPSCPVPTDLDYEINEGVAVLSWTSDATLFDIEVNESVIADVANPYNLELEPETIYEVRVRANCGDGDYSDWTDYIAFVSDCSGAKDLPYTYGFEDLGDYYACWMAASYNTSNNVNLAYDPNDDTNIVLRFSSYNSATDYRQILVSPELNTEEPVIVQFDYITATTSAETFQVGYATGDFASVDDFTFGDAMSVNNNTEWTRYTDTLPAGTKYVAILYSSNYQYYLYVDNFHFEELVTNVTQTISLNAGANWISTYVDITLDDLKAALVAAMPGTQMTITSQTQSTTYNGTRWRGQLNTLDVTMMYKIETVAEAEITLEGMPLDPASMVININEGNNWIAFPLSENMSLTNAFAGFAVAGDAIKSNTQSATYNGTRWRGALTTLTPGMGYMFVSTVAETRPFVYPIDAKKSTMGKKVMLGNVVRKSIKSSGNNLIDRNKKAK